MVAPVASSGLGYFAIVRARVFESVFIRVVTGIRTCAGVYARVHAHRYAHGRESRH